MGSTTVSSDATDEVGLPVSSRTFDAVVAVFSLLTVAGIAADFRSHANGISFAEEGFLTAEHVFFYSAFLVVAVTLFAGTILRRRRGMDWVTAVPPGYRWGIVGVLVFGFGGVGDFVWHSAFGFEESFEALVSPSHLTLAVGSVLFLASPLRAAARRGDDADTALAAVPVVVSMTLVLAILSMFGGFVNPLVRPYPHYEYHSMRSVVTMLVAWPLVYVGATVATLRRFELVPGAFTVAFGLSAFAVAQAEGFVWLVVPAVVAGVLADVFAVHARRVGVVRALRSRSFTAFAAGLPAAFTTTYFTVVDLTVGIDHSHVYEGMFNWSIHVVVGAVVLAALAGVLFASVVVDGRTASTAAEVS
ncbi:hypothetical protein [Halorubellus sp. PRR65]|uniref:hypothetical protein n=1 Tax=Halorubellus sp. PRR65 TaxID=3098148 RepID=UPI002B25C1AD|nr:hypothetical protein [Halorubellus sp. PRR65]